MAAAAAEQTGCRGCGEGCLNRLSFICCDPRLCPCGEECSNRWAPVQRVLPAAVEQQGCWGCGDICLSWFLYDTTPS